MSSTISYSFAFLMHLILLYAILTACDAATSTITVAPSCSPSQACDGGGGGGGNGTLDQALKMVESGASEVVLELLPGCHCVGGYTFVENATDLTLAGLGRREEVVIRCAKGRGLPFFNTTRLSITNLTVDGCGLTGTNLTSFHDRLNTLIDFFYEIPTRYRIAVLCGICSDFKLTNAVIKNSNGLGFLGVNTIGNSYISNVNFSMNVPYEFCFHTPVINTSYSDLAGGGAIFIYHDYLHPADHSLSTLTVTDSYFYKNSYCGFESIFELYYDTSQTAKDYGFVLGAGGGFSVLMAQVGYTVNASVFTTTFKNNTARYGAGAFIAMFSGITGCHAWFHDCIFERNGLDEDSALTEVTLVNSAAGIMFFKDISRPNSTPGPLAVPITAAKSNSLRITQTNFTANKASTAAALLIVSEYVSAFARSGDFVHVDGCMFTENVGAIAGLLYAVEKKASGEQSGLTLYLNNIVVVNNQVFSPSDQAIRSPIQTASLMSFSAMEVNISGDCIFADNTGTVLRAVSSVLHFYDNVTFLNNSGVFGGALRILASSFVVFHNYSHIVFRKNAAAVQGGAIYADFSGGIASYIYYDCIVYFDRIDLLCLGTNGCPDVRTSTARIEFFNNTAKSGSIMFGSTLDTCPWGAQLKQKLGRKDSLLFDILYSNLSSVFNFNGVPPTSTDIVSTPTKSIMVHGSPSVPVKPGQKFYINVTGQDHFDREIPLVLTSLSAISDTGYIVSTLGDSGYWFTGQGKLTPASVRGYTYQRNVSVDLFATDSLAQTSFVIQLAECAPGFHYDNVMYTCECDEAVLEQTSVACSPSTQTFDVPSSRWIGLDEDNQLVYSVCLFDYCELGERNITPPDFDTQCHRGYNRGGLLCGMCKENYSIGFATNRCLKCTNNFGLWWIPFFAVAGIVIILGITFLRITIADGYLNGILLYCNIVALYETTLLSDTPLSQYFVAISFLNLNLGIESCFFQGMGQLTRVGLQFIFPLYLYFLMIGITILAKFSQRFSRILAGSGFSATKLFATLMIMTYTSVFETCAQVLAAVEIKTLSGKHSIRWRLDPSQEYFSGVHAFLGIFSILLFALYIIPFPLLLIFQNIAFKIKWVRRLKPIYDVFGAPFKPKFRFWIGLRLLLRVVPLAFISALSSPLNVALLGIAVLVLLFVQVLASPFDGEARNGFDVFFLCNIILLSIFSLYFTIHIVEGSRFGRFEYYHNLQYAFVCLVVSLAYVAFTLIFMWHMVLRFPSLKKLPVTFLRKLKARAPKSQLLSRLQISINTASLTYGATESGSNNSGSANGDFDELSSDGEQVTPVQYSELREPLLDEGSVDLVPVETPNSTY